MLPNQTTEIVSQVSVQNPAPVGVVGVLLPTERGPVLEPTYIASPEQFKRVFGDSLGEATASGEALKALSKGARLMVSRIVPLLTQGSKTAFSWVAQKFSIVTGSGGAATLASPTTLVLNSTYATSIIAGLASATNHVLDVYVQVAGFTGALAGSNGFVKLGSYTITSTTTAAELINLVGEDTAAILPGWTKVHVEDTTVTYTAGSTLNTGFIEQPASSAKVSSTVAVTATGVLVKTVAKDFTRGIAANKAISLVIRPKTPDAINVPYYWGIRPAASGTAGVVDVFMGDSRYPQFEEVVTDVPKAYTNAVLADITANNSYLSFVVEESITFSNVELRLVPKRNLNFTSDSFGTYTAGTYTAAPADADYIGDSVALTGIHSFSTTSVPDLYWTPAYISAPVDTAITNYVNALGSVNGEPGYMAQYVTQNGAPTSTIKGAMDYFTASTKSPLKIALALGHKVMRDGRVVTVSYLPDFVAAWSRQAASRASNFIPAGEYEGLITDSLGVPYDVYSPAYKAEADYAYSKGLIFPKVDNGQTYIWGIRSADTSGVFFQASVTRTLVRIKRNISLVAGIGLFGPNDIANPDVQRRRKAIINVLQAAQDSAAIQSYTFKGPESLPQPIVPVVNEYRYEFTVVPTFSTEQINGKGIVTTESNTISFI